MLKINFESEAENFNEDRKKCVCKKKIKHQRALKRNAQDAADAIVQVMILCGIPEYKARCAIDIIVKSLTFFDEIYYRVDRVPRKRLCKEDLMYRTSCCCQFSRRETQLTYAITRRVFRALYFNTRQCGERVEAHIQTRHSQECVLVHAAKRIAQILAIIEGMFFETQIMFEKRIKCIFKTLHDKLQLRALGYEFIECECPKCLEKKRKSTKINENQDIGSSSSSVGMLGRQAKFCLKVCTDKEKEMKLRKGDYTDEEEVVEEIPSYFYKCDCPKLTCDAEDEKEFRVPSLDCSQGPFACNWIPMSADEDICDEICSEPELEPPCIEVQSSEHDSDMVCPETNAEEETIEPFIDDFDEGTVSVSISQHSCHIFRCPSDVTGEFEEGSLEDSGSVEDPEKSPRGSISKKRRKKRKDNKGILSPDIFDVNKRKTDKGDFDGDKDLTDHEKERTGKGEKGDISDKPEKDADRKKQTPSETTDDPNIKKVDKTGEPADRKTERTERIPEIKPPHTKTPGKEKTDKDQSTTEGDPSEPGGSKDVEKEPKTGTGTGKPPVKPAKDGKRVSKGDKDDKNKSPSSTSKNRKSKSDTTDEQQQDETEDELKKKSDEPKKDGTKKVPSRASKPKTDDSKKRKRSSGGSYAGVPLDRRRSSAPRGSATIRKQTPRRSSGKRLNRDGQPKKSTDLTKPPTKSTPKTTSIGDGGPPTAEKTKIGKRVGKQILPCCVCPKKPKKFIKRPKCVEEPDIYYPFED